MFDSSICRAGPRGALDQPDEAQTGRRPMDGHGRTDVRAPENDHVVTGENLAGHAGGHSGISAATAPKAHLRDGPAGRRDNPLEAASLAGYREAE
jgi:hypothetical protein